MENYARFIPVDAINGLSVGKEYYVVIKNKPIAVPSPWETGPYNGFDTGSITFPNSVQRLKIKGLSMRQEYATFTVKVEWDMSSLGNTEHIDLDQCTSEVFYNWERECRGKEGLLFSEKEAGAVNMCSQASKKAKENLRKKSEYLRKYIDKTSVMLAKAHTMKDDIDKILNLNKQ